MTSSRKAGLLLLWISRTCLIISIVGIPVVTYYYPLNIPFHGLKFHIELILWWPVAITLYAWLWPTVGGAVAMLYGFLEIIGLFLGQTSLNPGRAVVVPAHFILYGIFIIGGFLHVLTGTRQLPSAVMISLSESRYKRMHWAARLMTIVPFIAFVVFSYLDHGLPWIIFGGIPAAIMIGVAWFWPKLGGALLIAYAIFTFRFILGIGRGPETQIVLSAMWAVFLAGGILFAYLGKRYRRGPAGAGQEIH